MENNNEMINKSENLSAQPETEQPKTEQTTPAKGRFPNWIFAAAAVALCAVIAVIAIITFGRGAGNGSDIGSYTVYAVDEIGNPVSGILIRLTDADGEAHLAISEGGVATFDSVKLDNLKVEAEKGASNFNILHIVRVDNSSVKVIVRDPSKAQEIYGEIPDDSYAYSVNVGTYTIPAIADEPTYLVFMTATTGTYRISIESEYDGATVGYYGMPLFVQSSHKGEGEYDGRCFDFIIQDIAAPNVLGIKTDRDCEVTLSITREGDAPFNPHYLPWEEVKCTESFKEFSTGALAPVDISAMSISLKKGADGYYYIGAKRVYMRITTTSEYLDASLSMIGGFENEQFGQNIGGYVYDDNGEFVGKYSYNSMIKEYKDHCDANGVYPLTDELIEAIKLHGESVGWWNPGTANFLFEGKAYNPEYAWMFLCCTEK